MKPNAIDRTVSGNLTGDHITMGFAKGAEKHLMGLLAGMYSDMELAIIREYATNAYDSHTEAGQQRPIEVSLPSPLSPYLKIKDYGVGMSVQDIHRTYSQYGASTKRDSNAYNGMLGIGSKAALAYGGQFSVVAVMDGVKTTVAVTRDQDGSNSMVVVDTSSTADGNGVEISIPVKGGNEIERKAHEFFSFWPTGSVLLNGAPPKSSEDAGLKISDDIKLVRTDRYSGGQSRVVMGNVPYPCPQLSADELGIPYSHSIIAYVGVGEVDFAPSREALTFSKHTNERLAKIKADFRAGLVAAVQREIEKAGTAHEAVRAVNQWARLLGRNRPASFRHKGRDIPTQIVRPQSPRADGSHARLLLTDAANYRLSSAPNMGSINFSYAENSVFVMGYDMANFTVTHKKKLLQWLDKHPTLHNDRFGTDNQVSKFVLADFQFDTSWIAPERVVDWATIQLEQLPKNSNGGPSGRLAGSYDILVKVAGTDKAQSKWGEDGKNIDRSKPLYWLHGNLQRAWGYATVLSAIQPEYTIICLPKNRIDKFCRENPKIESVASAIDGAYAKWEAKLSKDEKQALSMRLAYYGHNAAERVSRYASRIDDPEVVRWSGLSKLNVDKLQNEYRAFGGLTNRGTLDDVPDPMDNYPLADWNSPNETIEYMNWKFAQRLDV